MNSADRALQDKILVLKPGEERRENPPYVVDSDLAGFVLFLEDRQVCPEVIRCIILDCLRHVPEKLLDGSLVILDGLGRAPLDKLRRQEYLQQTIIGDNVLLDLAAFVDERVAAQCLK